MNIAEVKTIVDRGIRRTKPRMQTVLIIPMTNGIIPVTIFSKPIEGDGVKISVDVEDIELITCVDNGGVTWDRGAESYKYNGGDDAPKSTD